MGFSKVTATVLLFGFGMIASGMLMQIFKGAFVNRVKDLFWIEGTPFLNLMDVESVKNLIKGLKEAGVL